jgi:hypothetical protein
MGVAASGATLEIQLVADVARLQRDMKDMQTIVKGATSSASRSFDDLAKGSVAAATAHAAAAQTIARSAVTGAAGVRSLGMAASNSNIAMLEMVHITRSVAAQLAAGASPLRAFSMELGRISTAVQYSSGGITGLIKQFAQMIGIISVTGDAELSAAAATAAASATSIKAVADRTASVLAAREAQVALAKVELGAVVGTDLEAAAQAKLVKAMRAAEVQSGKAVIASEALAAANAEAAASGGLAAAAMRTAFTPLGGILLGIGAAVGIALAAFVLFHDRARAKIDALIDKMREHYQKTLEQAEADRIWAQSLEGVAEAMGKVADQIEKTFTTEALTKTRELADAQRKLTDLLRQQKEAADALAAAQRANLTPQVGIGQVPVPSEIPPPRRGSRPPKRKSMISSARSPRRSGRSAISRLPAQPPRAKRWATCRAQPRAGSRTWKSSCRRAQPASTASARRSRAASRTRWRRSRSCVWRSAMPLQPARRWTASPLRRDPRSSTSSIS